MNNLKTVRVGLAMALAAGIGAAGIGAARAEEGVAIKNLLGTMGIIPPEKDPIRYRERAPLVLPPKMELREPAPAESYASNPQWPNDPDVAARKQRKALEATPVTLSETRRMSDNNPRLSVEEIRQGRNPNAKNEFRSYRGDNARDVVLLSPDELRKRKPDPDEAGPGGVEPVRRTLTDPPSGMRRASTGGKLEPDWKPKVDQQTLDANPFNWIKEQFSRDEDE